MKRFVDGATDARSRCADVGCGSNLAHTRFCFPFMACARLLDTAAALELSSQSLRDKIVKVTSILDGNLCVLQLCRFPVVQSSLSSSSC